ncbi:MAG TPA: HAD family hydrolase [Ignavibacteriaceae bacterium]|nr:HAD family hydrolase [Ignavibacteriaceae bacterium]
MKKYKGIIFDIDGTLTSTNQLIFASFNYVAKKYLNRTYKDEELIKLFGPTEDVILRQWCPDNYDEARKDYYNFYSENHHMADLYPGIIDILKYLKSKNIYLSIYTGKGNEASVITLKKLGIYEYFDLIITGDHVKEHKPSPEGIHLFMQQFNLQNDEVLMIGDSHVDIKAARAANVKVVSVIWDSLSIDKVKALGTDYLFKTVEDLYEFIKKEIK